MNNINESYNDTGSELNQEVCNLFSSIIIHQGNYITDQTNLFEQLMPRYWLLTETFHRKCLSNLIVSVVFTKKKL